MQLIKVVETRLKDIFLNEIYVYKDTRRLPLFSCTRIAKVTLRDYYNNKNRRPRDENQAIFNVALLCSTFLFYMLKILLGSCKSALN